MGLHVSNAPYVFSRDTTRVLMLDVVIAMLPTALVGVWFFGLRALLHLVIGVASAVAAEYAYQRLTGKPVRIGDCSAIVTGMLVALNMPAPAPLWLPLIGSVAAIVLVKELFGGIGGNFMNPALTARAILMISWPVAMTSYTLPVYSLMPGVGCGILRHGAGGVGSHPHGHVPGHDPRGHRRGEQGGHPGRPGIYVAAQGDQLAYPGDLRWQLCPAILDFGE